jgi:hypothetical protein
MLDDGFPQRDLAIAGHDYVAIPAHAQNSRRSN